MSRSVRFGTPVIIPDGSKGTEQPESPSASLLSAKISNLGLQSNPPESQLWKIPGIDKDTFYAAALYLHVKAGELEGRAWSRGPKTPQATREFLDHLADCFARSKLRDARDHVSATTMVRDDEQKKITLYIAKNRSSKGSEASISQEKESAARNENKEFADQLVGWFNSMARNEDADHKYAGIFQIMCKFNQSRLENYIARISQLDVGILERALPLEPEQKCKDGWEAIKSVIEKCSQYQAEKSIDSQDEITRPLADCAAFAGIIRKSEQFHHLSEKVNGSASNSGLKRLTKAVEGVQYLGRLYAAYTTFGEFCKSNEQKGFSFEHVILPSQEDRWNGASYLHKIQSWEGDLGLDDVETFSKMQGAKHGATDMAVKDRLEEVAIDGRETAPVHCEIQLLAYFLRPNAPKCVDYFGCSKKSCWLCWHMMVQNFQFSMKDTHRKIYPRWALPSKFTLSHTQAAEGLKIAYNEMLSLLQHKVIKGTNLKSSGPLIQSSARITPWPGLGYFSGKHIEASEWGLFPLASIPFLYIPPDGSAEDARPVTVAVYEWPSSLYKYISTAGVYGDSKITFAFQLKMDSKFKTELTAGRDPLLELDEYQSIDWVMGAGYSEYEFGKTTNYYRLFYRGAEALLGPNRSFLEAWRSTHGDLHGEFPWCGDVFVARISPEATVGTQWKGVTDNVDGSTFFEDLAFSFSTWGPGYAYKIREENRAHATKRMKLYGIVAR
ncbi:hypothetical protein F5Y01DRAFT_237628 [Xylaria sp. FL0043]|nr:hypothetical protein F5Y01DRAFT_237628 [Xylaria sp. FL0043]